MASPSLVNLPSPANKKGFLPFFLFNAIGILIFFVSLDVGGKNTIVLDHICTWFKSVFGSAIPWITLLLILYCLVDTFFIRKIWKKNATEMLMTCAKLFSLAVMFMAFTGYGPEVLFDKRIIPILIGGGLALMFLV